MHNSPTSGQTSYEVNILSAGGRGGGEKFIIFILTFAAIRRLVRMKMFWA